VYEVAVIAANAGRIRSSSGLELFAARGLEDELDVDTLLVSGGVGAPDAVADAHLLDWLRQHVPGTRRWGSVCTGTLLLAAAGLLDGRRVATHWGWIERLARLAPTAQIEPDAIFVRDGELWTSAGVTAGMDMALAMVEDDWGHDLALAVARQLVLFLKRPGGQSQFSAQLAAQSVERSDRFGLLVGWILEHLDADLSLESLAERAAMSPRNFSRTFRVELGASPGSFVERARLDEARRLLEDTRMGVEQVAARCGLGTSESLRRLFVKRLRVSPSAYRERFARPVAH
jgi:transcriptional regulator GlxA family with amidase domain